MFKKQSELGAQLWNGVIWKLTASGNGLAGTPQAVYLNRVASPPVKTTCHPSARRFAETLAQTGLGHPARMPAREFERLTAAALGGIELADAVGQLTGLVGAMH